MKSNESKIKAIVSKLNYFAAIVSFVAAVGYGAWYIAVYEIRLGNVEKKEERNERTIEGLDDRLDVLYAILRRDNFSEIIGKNR